MLRSAREAPRVRALAMFPPQPARSSSARQVVSLKCSSPGLNFLSSRNAFIAFSRFLLAPKLVRSCRIGERAASALGDSDCLTRPGDAR
jgi:hypothetical protein